MNLSTATSWYDIYILEKQHIPFGHALKTDLC